ncbi:MAG: hypothetical protein ABIR06_06135 [Cyclobacteriaceae bacterium]
MPRLNRNIQDLRLKVFSNVALNVPLKEGVVELKEILITSRPIDSNIEEPSVNARSDECRARFPAVQCCGGRVDQNLV